jgi:two-component system OmpR family sensor kinase
VARAELARVNRLVGDLLALGRSGQAGFLHRRGTSAAALAREVEVRVDGLGLDTVTVAPAPDTAVDVDADRLMQAVLNCIVNAVEHNPTGTTVDVEIDVTDPEPDADAAPDGIETLVIRVEDDGAGIPPEVAEIAFEPFTVGVSERDRLRSSGLGLAVVAAVATAHGGTAALQPADHGTIVELRLPAHPPSTTDAEMTESSASDQVPIS